MNAEEINKVYECCKDSFHRRCDDCPVVNDCCHDKMPLFVLKYAIELLKEQQEIILCKDCKHGQKIYGCKNEILCIVKGLDYAQIVPSDWFCANRERTDN